MKKFFAIAVAAASIVVAACDANDSRVSAMRVTGGDPDAGARAIRAYGCHTCHTIPGIRPADAVVGPPLSRMGVRVYIAGALPNTPDNLMLWIQHPQRVEPGTAMPDLGVTPEDARNIVAYLYTLR